MFSLKTVVPTDIAAIVRAINDNNNNIVKELQRIQQPSTTQKVAAIEQTTEVRKSNTTQVQEGINNETFITPKLLAEALDSLGPIGDTVYDLDFGTIANPGNFGLDMGEI